MGLKSLEIRLKLLKVARREIFSSCGVNLATKVGFKRDKTFRRVRRRPARHVHAYRSNADNSIDSYVYSMWRRPVVNEDHPRQVELSPPMPIASFSSRMCVGQGGRDYWQRRRGDEAVAISLWSPGTRSSIPSRDHAPLEVLREVTSVELALLAARFVYVYRRVLHTCPPQYPIPAYDPQRGGRNVLPVWGSVAVRPVALT
eukprot:scaffold90162_cov56-Phaeocystis_antarctica.AAC.2